MIHDERTEFLDANATSGTGVSQLVGDVIDTQLSGSLNLLTGLDNGESIYLVITCDTSASGGTSIQFQLASDSTADLATSRTNHLDTGAVAVASFVAPDGVGKNGYVFVRELPRDFTYERYLGIWMTTVGAVTAAKTNAFLTRDAARWKAYAKNY